MDNNYNGYSQNSYMQPDQGQGAPYMQPQEPRKGCGFGIAALVIGILSMTLCCVGGSVLGIAGTVLGIVGLCRKESKFGLAIAGIVTSVLGVLIGIYMLFVVFVAGVAYDEIKDMDEYEMQEWLQEQLRSIENGDFTRADDPDLPADTAYGCVVSFETEYADLLRLS